MSGTTPNEDTRSSGNETIDTGIELVYTRLALVPAFITLFFGGFIALGQCGVCPPQDVIWPVLLAAAIILIGRLADRMSTKRGQHNE